MGQEMRAVLPVPGADFFGPEPASAERERELRALLARLAVAYVRLDLAVARGRRAAAALGRGR